MLGSLLSFLGSFLLVLLEAVLLTALQTGAAIGAMFLHQRSLTPALGPAEYEGVDLEHFDQAGLLKLLPRLTLLILIPTAALLLILFLLMSNIVPTRFGTLKTLLLAGTFLTHFAVLLVGFIKIYQVHPKTAAYLAAFTTIAYMILFYLLAPMNLLMSM